MMHCIHGVERGWGRIGVYCTYSCWVLGLVSVCSLIVLAATLGMFSPPLRQYTLSALSDALPVFSGSPHWMPAPICTPLSCAVLVVPYIPTFPAYPSVLNISSPAYVCEFFPLRSHAYPLSMFARMRQCYSRAHTYVHT